MYEATELINSANVHGAAITLNVRKHKLHWYPVFQIAGFEEIVAVVRKSFKIESTFLLYEVNFSMVL